MDIPKLKLNTKYQTVNTPVKNAAFSKLWTHDVTYSNEHYNVNLSHTRPTGNPMKKVLFDYVHDMTAIRRETRLKKLRENSISFTGYREYRFYVSVWTEALCCCGKYPLLSSTLPKVTRDVWEDTSYSQKFNYSRGLRPHNPKLVSVRGIRGHING